MIFALRIFLQELRAVVCSLSFRHTLRFYNSWIENTHGARCLQLTVSMETFGLSIIQTLLTDIEPAAKVKAAMNEINAATRLRSAAVQKAEADKVQVVKAAEADAEAKFLSGQGIARQRQVCANTADVAAWFVPTTIHRQEVPKDQSLSCAPDIRQYERNYRLLVPENSGFKFIQCSGMLACMYTCCSSLVRAGHHQRPPRVSA